MVIYLKLCLPWTHCHGNEAYSKWLTSHVDIAVSRVQDVWPTSTISMSKYLILRKLLSFVMISLKDGSFDKHASPSILSIKENAIVTDCVLLFKYQHNAPSNGSKPINKRLYVKVSKRNVSFVTLVLTNEKCPKYHVYTFVCTTYDTLYNIQNCVRTGQCHVSRPV